MKKNESNEIREPEVVVSNDSTPEENTLTETSSVEVTEATEEVQVSEEEGTEIAPVEEAAPIPVPIPERIDSKKKSLSELTEIDPDVLTGEETVKQSKKLAKKQKTKSKNEVAPILLDLSGKKTSPEASLDAKKKGGNGIGFVILAVVVVLIALAVAIFYKSGIKDRLQSPVSINGQYIDSAEFSFMYHYILIDNGVDIFGAETQEMLNSPSDDPNFATNRDYFLDLTARQMQTMQILYDDATEHGLEIGSEHYTLARAYIDWLQGKADELGVDLNTYIRGVFGSQVDEQVVMNTLAKLYFTEDYASGAKLIELQATEEQAEEAYQLDRNTYDLVDYKILRITYEQRDEAFLNTANLHADEIMEGIGHDPDNFEAVASSYFSGEAGILLSQPNSTLQKDARYSDFTHLEFRDWLFDPSRTPGDTVKFFDSDGFPIILCFVSRNRQSEPLRDVRFIKVNTTGDDGSELHTISEAQMVAQGIYDYVSTETDMMEIENIYNDEVLTGGITVTHSTDTYREKYDGILGEWIFADNRKAGDKAFLETNDGYYIVYMISISEKPEWYDRVNSFIRMRNYQAFLNEMEDEYSYEFIQSGIDKIQDVP
ncbi:MAG: hypothetical protein MJ093_05580 [Saccharofermentans sp.]|nr:hypothetical protein [Saccharofermentans sp.]